MAYLSLSTANLPNPVIDPAQGSSPSDYFDIDTYTGTGATHERSNFTFQPDWLWIKRRSTADNHTSWDSVRGVNKVLKPNETGAEGTDATQISSFDADGFTLLSGGDVNASGETFVAWCWKANGTGVSNTDGSITSTVSANTEAGFSIVSYTGNGTSGATVGHGLTTPPDWVVTHRRDSTSSWRVYHSALGATKMIELHTTGAAETNGVWANTAPTSSVFSLSSFADVNANTGTYIAYCFHSVEGYSKFGSYVGNGGGGGTSGFDGPFVYTGFRPSFVLVKNADAGWNWIIWDDERDPYNQVNGVLQPNSSNAEYDVGGYMSVDFLSNGFKIRSNDAQENGNGNTHIYMAFSANPFKYSTGF